MSAERNGTVTVVPALALAAALAVACSDPAEPGVSHRHPGILQYEGGTGLTTTNGVANDRDTTVRWDVSPGEGVITAPQVLEAPEQVRSGEPFAVVVTTIGPSGCWSADRIEVDVDEAARTVVLLPYDLHSGAEICTLVLRYLRHEATLTLGEPGEWLIRVSGRKARHGDSVWEEPVSAETTVVVEP